MADTPDSTDQQLPSADGGQKPPFLATSTGRIVVIGAALAVVAIVGVLVWLFVMNSGFFAEDGAVVPQTVPVGGVASKNATETGAPIVDPPRKPLESTFTFRNVFAPTVKRPVEATLTIGSSTETSSGSGSSGDVLDLPADTLFLESIQTTDGQKTATLIWNNERYTVGEGDTIAGTPWKVLEINDESVVMLYGDTEVTLTVGQGLSK
jgi:hypothetical protein